MKYLLGLLLLAGIYTGSMAQEKVKFGEVPADDLSMVVYPEDSAAVAVTLHEDCEVSYLYRQNDFQVKKTYFVRVKILKPAGVNRANIFIPFFTGGTSNQNEVVSDISGYIYNLVDGKVERTKLEKEHIFKENTSDQWSRMKIAFPTIKQGSIFELKYEKITPYYSFLEDFVFQSEDPVRYSRYQVTIPEFFIFGKRSIGYERVDYAEKTVNLYFIVGAGQTINCAGQEMTFVATNLPAMKNDDYVWNKNDYMTRISFDLMSINVPGVLHKNFTVKWEDVDKQLMQHEQFGKQLNFSNLMKAELAATLKAGMSSNEKVNAILELIKEKIQWNDENTLYISNVKKAVKEGKGSSAEMNAALIGLLRDAKFNAYPVVMSRRSRGRIFSFFPTQKSLNYFVVGVDIDGKPAYMDASDKYGAVNVLLPDCMVEEARCIYKNSDAAWVDLHEIGRNSFRRVLNVAFNEEGKLAGNLRTTMTGVPYMTYKRKIDKINSLEDTQSEIEAAMNVRISNLEIGEPQSSTITEKFSFVNEAVELGADFIYINPIIFPFTKENPFKEETRKLPVEFPFAYTLFTSVTLEIPENYTVEELPVNESVTFGDEEVTFSLQVENNKTNVQILQRMNLMNILYPATEYDEVRNFWAYIADKNNTQLVLKRIAKTE